jgi:hypothetical protein
MDENHGWSASAAEGVMEAQRSHLYEARAQLPGSVPRTLSIPERHEESLLSRPGPAFAGGSLGPNPGPGRVRSRYPAADLAGLEPQLL